MNKAVFIDKDGTLIENIPFNVDTNKVRFTHGAVEALAQLKQFGFLLILVSNQSGVARGLFTEEALHRLQDGLQKKLASEGVPIDGFFFCPHHPEGKLPAYAMECECRKPKPGMILAAAKQYNVELSRSWMIGDILDDIEAGNKAGCKTILIDNGNETLWKFSEYRLPGAIVTDLLQAAKRIIYEPDLL